MHRILCLILFFITFDNYAWNALGHQLVAQVAYDNLTPQAKQMCDGLTQKSDSLSPNSGFIAASTWLDRIRGNDIHWYDSLHYIDIPFSKDKTRLPSVQHVNALWGVKQAVAVLSSSKSTPSDKELSLRILTHLVGDIHQPLHTVTKVSKKHPKGDLGGNLYILATNPIGNNLHQYWDNGAGVLIGQSKTFQVQNKASQLEKKWSCALANKKKKPQEWIKEAHQLALTEVYTLRSHNIPSKKYQLNAQNVTQKQILFAGCRLATVLNAIATEQRNTA